MSTGMTPPISKPASIDVSSDREAPAGQTRFAAAVGVVLASAVGAYVVGPGPMQLGLALVCAGAAGGAAALLPASQRLALLVVAASALRFALPAATGSDASARLTELVRQLAYFAVAPLALHWVLRLRARSGGAPLGLSVPALYAPAAAVFLALAGYTAWAQRDVAGAGMVRVVYGVFYALLLAGLMWRELRAPAPAAPTPKERAAALEQQGRFGVAQRYYAQSDRLDKAAEMAERAGEWARAAELYRRTGDTFRAAEMAFRAERFGLALELYQKAGAHAAAALTAERLGRSELAAQLFERAGDAAAAVRVLEGAGRKPSADLYARAGRLEDAVIAWQEEGHYARAAEVLEQEFHDLEGAAQVHFNGRNYRRAAELYEHLGNLPAAIDACLAAPDLQVQAARLCAETGDLERAGAIVAALPENGVDALDDDATLLMLARVEERTGRVESALRLLQKLRRRAEPPPEVYLPLGRCLLARGLTELAEENLRVAHELRPGGDAELEAAYLLGRVLEERGKNGEAAEAYLDLLRKDLAYRDVEERYRRLATPA